MSAYTPGPWTAREWPESEHFNYIVRAPSLYVGISTDSTEANARLIAAAPQLVEALALLADVAEATFRGDDDAVPARLRNLTDEQRAEAVAVAREALRAAGVQS